MKEWIIEDDVPLPPPHQSRPPKGHARALTEALRDLKVGQSLFTKEYSAATLGGRHSTLTRVWGYRYATRSVDGGVRVWRTE